MVEVAANLLAQHSNMEAMSLFNLQGEEEYNILQIQDWQHCKKTQRKTCSLVSLFITQVMKQEANVITVYFVVS